MKCGEAECVYVCFCVCVTNTHEPAALGASPTPKAAAALYLFPFHSYLIMSLASRVKIHSAVLIHWPGNFFSCFFLSSSGWLIWAPSLLPFRLNGAGGGGSQPLVCNQWWDKGECGQFFFPKCCEKPTDEGCKIRRGVVMKHRGRCYAACVIYFLPSRTNKFANWCWSITVNSLAVVRLSFSSILTAFSGAKNMTQEQKEIMLTPRASRRRRLVINCLFFLIWSNVTFIGVAL